MKIIIKDKLWRELSKIRYENNYQGYIMMIIMKDSYFVRNISLFCNTKYKFTWMYTEDHDHFFVITLILVSIPVQSLSALMAYHLTCQHVKFSSSLFFFLSSVFCDKDFAMFASSNQHTIFHDHLSCHEVVCILFL